MANFKVSARTVDMLGRQQIAGIPTAISELFKNAHDAYADTVEVDYFRDDGLFVLRDDGLGMTKADFEQRWLTLGTDSKLKGGSIKQPARDKTKKVRPVLGEKGIGRLAIALIGSQVLVLTRAKKNGVPHDKTVAAYIHWGMFEIPGLDLSDIVIPVEEFAGGSVPSFEDVQAMTNIAMEALKAIKTKSNSDKVDSILADMKSFTVDPKSYHKFLGEPSLMKDGCGTHFYILPADPIIEADIDDDSEGATRFEKSLIGFTNTMTPGHSSPVISTQIRDHRDEGDPVEIIGNKTFFTPEEFSKVDHHVSGRFDEFGQFRGTVAVYHTKPEPYVLNWPDSSSVPTECGPFSFSFAFLQGQARNSLVPPDEYGRLYGKLFKHGGLYVYRDGIRVQPYGDSDYDFLNIEKRRTKGAGYYVYSYRRIMGTIELSGAKNSRLMEKAGREGFSENKAYRQFRSILMNFFVQSAGDFFRDGGQYASDYVETQDELERLFEIKKRNDKKRKVKKEKFADSIEAFFKNYDAEDMRASLSSILEETEIKLNRIINNKAEPSQKALSLLRIEKDQRAKVNKVRNSVSISKPRGLVSNSELRNEWAAYLNEFQNIESTILNPYEAKIEALISEKIRNSKIPLQAVTRLEEKIKLDGRISTKRIKDLKADTDSSLNEISTKVKEITKKSFGEINSITNNIIQEIGSLKRSNPSDAQFSETREKLENKLSEVFEKEKENLERLRDQISLVSQSWTEGYSSIELTEALEYEVEELEAQNESNLELAQIGMAINTINHEFEKTVGSLRNGFRRLNKWAEFNPDIQSLYQDMRNNFDHLDSYLSLFTPFDRRLNRKSVDITGKDIFDFLNDLFESRFERHKVTLTPTSSFLKSSVHGYPSSFYPVFVNLVDNSIFWLDRIADVKRTITLDFENNSFVVHDNGPGVSRRDHENIFALRFTRKPLGRGMGLYISRETLNRIDYDLTLDTSRSVKGARFLISPK